MTFNPDAATVYADGPSTEPYEPSKPQIRTLLKQYETVMNAFTTNAGLIYTTLAAMNAAATTFTEPRSAWLFDGTNSGVYVLNPTTDTWTKVGRLPYDFVIGTDLGAGTANAIQITTDIPVADGMIVSFSLFDATTASPVTVSINGGTALTLKTNRGSNASALTAGMEIWGRVRSSDNTLRLLNDQDVSALVAQAEVAAAHAVAAANQKGLVLPELFGAVGDGVADDTAALQAFFDFVKNLRGVGWLSGKYRTTYTVFYGSGTHVEGPGEILLDITNDAYRDAVTLMPETYTYADDDNWVEDVTFRDFRINAPNGNGLSTSKARNINIVGLRGTAMYWHFLDLNGCKDVNVSDCYFGNSVMAAIQIDCLSAPGGARALLSDRSTLVNSAWSATDVGWNRTENVVVDRCTVFSVTGDTVGAVHLHRKFARGIKVINSHFDGCARGIFDDAVTDWTDVIISGNTFRNFATGSAAAIRLQNAYDGLTISGNTVQGTSRDPADGEEAIFVYGSQTKNGVQIIGNDISMVPKGIGLDNAVSPVISGNVFRNIGIPPADANAAAGAGCYGISAYGCIAPDISGNSFYDVYHTCMKIWTLGGTVQGGVVSGNAMYDCGGGVISRNQTKLLVSNNMLHGKNADAYYGVYLKANSRSVVTGNIVICRSSGVIGIWNVDCELTQINGNIVHSTASAEVGILVDGIASGAALSAYLASNRVDGTFSTAQLYASTGAICEYDEPFEVIANDGTCTLTDRRDGRRLRAVTAKAYTLVLADVGRHVTMSNGSANTVTISADATLLLPVGSEIVIQQIGAGASSVTPASGVTLNGGTSGVAIGAQWASKTLRKIAANTWTLG